MKKLSILLCVLCCVAAGCSQGNLTELDEGIMSRTSTANVGAISPEGTIQASYHGIGALALQQDADGNWLISPGPAGIASIPFGTSSAFVVSPNNMSAESVEVTPVPADGQAAIKVTGLEINISEPMSQQVAALQVALPILSEMTKTEAEATIEKWREAGKMAPSVLDLLAQFVALM